MRTPILFLSIEFQLINLVVLCWNFIRSRRHIGCFRRRLIWYSENVHNLFSYSEFKFFDQLLIKHNLLVVHIWMIDFTLRQNYYFRSSLFRKQLNYHLYKSPHSIVFHFEVMHLSNLGLLWSLCQAWIRTQLASYFLLHGRFLSVPIF